MYVEATHSRLLLNGMIGIPRPKKADRPNLKRKQEIKKKDREFSRKTETYKCEKCGRIGMTDPPHLVGRRYIEKRWDPNNISRLCRICHSLHHSGK